MTLQFDEKNANLATADPGMLGALEKGIKMRVKAKALKDESDELTKKANALLAPVLSALEIEETLVTQHGSISYLQNVENKSVSREKMERYLLENGVAPTLIKDAKENATTTRTSEYQIRFTPPKK